MRKARALHVYIYIQIMITAAWRYLNISYIDKHYEHYEFLHF